VLKILIRASKSCLAAVGGPWGVVAILVVLGGIPLFVEEIMSHVPLTEANPESVFIFLLYGTVLIVIFAILTALLTRNPKGEHVGWVAVLIFVGLSGTAYVLIAGAHALAVLSQRGIRISYSPKQATLDMSDLHAKLLFEALSTVPLLDVTGTLGWKDPVPHPAPALGWVDLAIKLLLILVVVSGIYRLFKAAGHARRWRLVTNPTGNIPVKRPRRRPQRSRRRPRRLRPARPQAANDLQDTGQD